MPLICKGSVPKQVEEETQGNQLAQVHVKKGRWNRGVMIKYTYQQLLSIAKSFVSSYRILIPRRIETVLME